MPTTKMNGDTAKQISQIAQEVAVMGNDISHIKSDVKDIKKKLTTQYVTKENHKVDMKNTNDKVKDLVDLKDWGLRIIIGTIIVALMAIIGFKS